MSAFIGRKEELHVLQEALLSNTSEFVAVYGRRRVGKTYLIRHALKDAVDFQVTGMANVNLGQQLTNFQIALQHHQPSYLVPKLASWLMAFQELIKYLETTKKAQKVIFIDELPWFDTKASLFMPALEHFWNSWASARNDIKLITCGSAASWMINELIRDKGGLHNRVTKRLKIAPFTLLECEELLRAKQSVLDRYQLIQLYMVLGGIPFYWQDISARESAAQTINRLCFTENGLLRTEFSNLFRALFNKPEKHIQVVRALATKAMGLTREDLLKHTKLPNAGSSTRIVEELEESGFIKKYQPFGKKNKTSLYQLVDFYTLFYLRFLEKHSDIDPDYWLHSLDSPQHRTWSGYAFEQVCLYHVHQIKQSLGISGMQTQSSSWRSSENKAQVDLLIDRKDHVINLCEMKYSISPFVIDKKYAVELQQKIQVFKQETKTRKAVFLTFISTFGVHSNTYSSALVQQTLEMDSLFCS